MRIAAEARGGRMKGLLRARTSSDPLGGFRYEVIEESGSALIRNRVLRAALEAEAEARRSGNAAGARLSEENYEFHAGETSEDGLLRIDIRARRKGPMLIDGSIFVTESDADLVRIEGTLVKRPSFWTRRVDIVRKYARLGGSHVPVSMTSTAEVVLAGRSTFSMSYFYEEINGISLAPATGSPPVLR